MPRHCTRATRLTPAPLPLTRSQLGLVQFKNMILADNGGGPLAHIVNGKDNGAAVELSWVVDDRNRKDVRCVTFKGGGGHAWDTS
jgi:hypothetical protein